MVFGVIFLPRCRQTTRRRRRGCPPPGRARGTAPTVSGADLVPALDELDELVDDRPRLGDPLAVTVEREPVPAERDRAAEPLSQRVEHPSLDAGELRRDLVGDHDDVLHPPSVGAGGAWPVPELTVLYDEGCGFCTRIARRLDGRRWIVSGPDRLSDRVVAAAGPSAPGSIRVGPRRRRTGRRWSGGAALPPLLRELPAGTLVAGARAVFPASRNGRTSSSSATGPWSPRSRGCRLDAPAILEQLLSGRYLATLATRNPDGLDSSQCCLGPPPRRNRARCDVRNDRKARTAALRPSGSILIDGRGPSDFPGRHRPVRSRSSREPSPAS